MRGTHRARRSARLVVAAVTAAVTAAPRAVSTTVISAVCAAAVIVASSGPAFAAATELTDNTPQNSIKVSEDIQENWSFSTQTPYWSALVVQPPPGWTVITDVGFDRTGFVRSNANGVTGLNFVAIDSNSGRRPYDSYFGRAIPNDAPSDWPGGPPSYDIVFLQGANSIGPGTNTITWPGTLFVAVRDLLLYQGQQVTLSVDPADTAYLLASDPADSSTWIQGRDSAAARTDVGTLQYTAPRSAWYGVILVNRRQFTSSTVEVTIN
jgi:hypothetical protein